MVEPGIEPGTSWLVVRNSDHQPTRLVSVGESFRLQFNSFHSTHEAPHLAFSGLDLFLNPLLKTVRLRVKPFKDSLAQSHITASGRPACPSWCRATPGAHDQIE